VGQPDLAAAPFQGEPPPVPDSEFVRPGALPLRAREQQALPTGSVLDRLCLTSDRSRSLGGIPKGCTISLVGPAGKGKTRTALCALARIAASGVRSAWVAAEESFHPAQDTGRDDLGSRMLKVGMAATKKSEADFREQVLSQITVLESQDHRGKTWADFVARYRHLVERLQVRFVVIDSLGMLEPSRTRAAELLAALKTYNQQHGVTCLCTGQLRDSTLNTVEGTYTADTVFLLEEMSLGSKEMAEQWGGKYREKIDVLRVVKSATTPTFPHLVRVQQEEGTGALQPHPAQPEEFALLA
jgi:KaiC/GvpD/RAD55 family RecA-like ATPase